MVKEEIEAIEQQPDAEAGAEESVPLVEFKSGKPNANGGSATVDKKAQALEVTGLTKEQLEHYAKDPFWRRLRLILFVLFWFVWLAMLAAVIVIIILSPKCPPRPQRQFWQKPFYRLQVRSFAPSKMQGSDSMKAGSLLGLRSKLPYLREQLGIDNIMIDSLVTRNGAGCIADFQSIDESLGSMEELRALTKLGRKKGFNLVMEFDPSQAARSWPKEPTEATKMMTPRPSCVTLNLTLDSPAEQRLLDAMRYWLDAGISGFMITNVAYIVPGAGNKLYSQESVQFVRRVRSFIAAEAERLGRPLALFVDTGNVDMGMATTQQLQNYTTVADAVLNTELGSSPASTVPKALDIGTIATVAEVCKEQRFAVASNWPYLARQPDPAYTALVLTLPGIPIIYYGQEIGMSTVPNVRLSIGASYLNGSKSTDPSQTPMQWAGSPANVGWLKNSTQQLGWVKDLDKRATDIMANNVRTLNSSGHPQSVLQLTANLLKLVNTVESLQWGELKILAKRPPGLFAFQRQAVRFPAAVLAMNIADKAETVSLAKGKAKLMLAFSWKSAKHSYKNGQTYKLDNVFVPPNTLLVFLTA